MRWHSSGSTYSSRRRRRPSRSCWASDRRIRSRCTSATCSRFRRVLLACPACTSRAGWRSAWRSGLTGDVKLQLEAGERELWLIERKGVLEHRLGMVEVRDDIEDALREAKERLQ